jgi:predicted DNA-binding transcriptional regulator AlpA
MKSPPQFPTTAAAKIDPASQFALSNFDNLPDSAFIRLPVLAALGLGSPATIWRKVKERRLPAPVKLSKQCAAWQVGAIRRHIAELVEKGGAQ